MAGGAPAWTTEQLYAIERRDGDLLLDASAGSGKTSVLVERFVRAVLEDGVAVEAILTITFTEKAAAEMRDRIRARLRELGADDAARATEGAFISTIHGFCARVLRAHALTAGIDPLFTVLDEPEADRLADAAFDEALEDLARNAPGGVELIAAYAPGTLRAGITAAYASCAPGGSSSRRCRRWRRCRTPSWRGRATSWRKRPRSRRPSSATVQSPAPASSRRSSAWSAASELLADFDDAQVPWPGEHRSILPARAATVRRSPPPPASPTARRWRACARPVSTAGPSARTRCWTGCCAATAPATRGASASTRRWTSRTSSSLTRELLRSDAELRERYRARFERIMVDELQDTNAVQLELIEQLARGQPVHGRRRPAVDLRIPSRRRRAV